MYIAIYVYFDLYSLIYLRISRYFNYFIFKNVIILARTVLERNLAGLSEPDYPAQSPKIRPPDRVSRPARKSTTLTKLIRDNTSNFSSDTKIEEIKKLVLS